MQTRRSVGLGLALAVVLAAPAPAQTVPPAPAGETASQFYLRYRASIPAAATLDQIVAHWSSDQRQEFSAAPSAERPDLALVKSVYAATTNVTVTKEAATPNYATLDLAGVMGGKAVTATVQLVREDGAWKVASGPERWQ